MPFLWIALGVLVAGLVLAERRFRVQFALPSLARTLDEKGQRPRAIQVCEKGLTLWVPGGERTRFDLRFFLAFLFLREKRPADAEAQCRLLLATKLPTYLRSKAERRLADSLEAQDRHAEAKELLARLHESVAADSSPDTLAERARLLSKQNQHAEALALFDQCLAAVPESAPSRTALEVERGLCAWNLGRYTDALQSCQAALQRGGLSPSLTRVANNIAAISLSSLSRFEEALLHKERVIAYDKERGNPDKLAESLAQLGNLRMQLGQLNEGMALVQEAVPLSLTGRRQACLVESEILALWGRFDDALDALERAERAPALAIPHFEARSQATLHLARARLYNHKGQSKQALHALEQTQAAFSGDTKLTIWVEAERVLAQATTGATAERDALLAKLPTLGEDPTTLRLVHSRLAETAARQSDFATALHHWECYQGLAPVPVDQPRIWYGIGEAQQGLGNAAAAQAAWEAAGAVGIDTHWARAAQKRRAERP